MNIHVGIMIKIQIIIRGKSRCLSLILLSLYSIILPNFFVTPCIFFVKFRVQTSSNLNYSILLHRTPPILHRYSIIVPTFFWYSFAYLGNCNVLLVILHLYSIRSDKPLGYSQNFVEYTQTCYTIITREQKLRYKNINVKLPHSN